jgi:hypothetical protein
MSTLQLSPAGSPRPRSLLASCRLSAAWRRHCGRSLEFISSRTTATICPRAFLAAPGVECAINVSGWRTANRLTVIGKGSLWISVRPLATGWRIVFSLALQPHMPASSSLLSTMFEQRDLDDCQPFDHMVEGVACCHSIATAEQRLPSSISTRTVRSSPFLTVPIPRKRGCPKHLPEEFYSNQNHSLSLKKLNLPEFADHGDVRNETRGVVFVLCTPPLTTASRCALLDTYAP